MAIICHDCKYNIKTGDVNYCYKQDSENYGKLIGDVHSCEDYEEDFYGGWRRQFYEAVKNIGGDD